MNNKARVLFLSHGGGPLPLLGDAGHTEMVTCLRNIAAKIGKPSAVIVISAHWEEKVPSITAGANPDLIYDYYGFPEESYRIQYPCPGDPKLAGKIRYALENAHIETKLDVDRGFDHGVFVPLKIMYPEADIPVVQVSLLSGLIPENHLSVGRALQAVRQDDLLVIGSGFSFHNMEAFFAQESKESKTMNESFEAWLIDTCSNAQIDEDTRAHRLIGWANAPSARFCHPREEHLLPIHVCYGVANAPSSEHFELNILGKKSSMYLW